LTFTKDYFWKETCLNVVTFASPREIAVNGDYGNYLLGRQSKYENLM